MNLDLLPHRVIETADRRVMGALQFVDAVTRLPVVIPARLEVRGATIAGAPVDAGRQENAIRILQNRRGVAVIFRAPFFDTYAGTFDNPSSPPETQPNPLRLLLAVTDAGPYYLPQAFHVDLPRSLDPEAPDSVFQPQNVGLFRAPNAPAQNGWALLRVRVTEAGVNPPNPLPGVLVRVFRAPRGVADAPIGAGMTDWRGDIRGEALVPLIGIQRFRPGSGANVIETDQAIAFEAMRDGGFTGAAGQLPDGPSIAAATPAAPLEILRPETTPTTPMRVEAGREYVVHLAMP